MQLDDVLPDVQNLDSDYSQCHLYCSKFYFTVVMANKA